MSSILTMWWRVLSARLMQTAAAEVVGPGTGVQGEALEAKRALVEKALDRTLGTDEPLAVLRRLG